MSDDPAFFERRDPWAYQTTRDDARRKQIILHTLNLFGPFSRALDIGAHEGWLTTDVPASTRHGYEISDLAAARFPANVTRVLDPAGKYDLVLATGVLYPHYNWEHFVSMISARASRIVLACSIKPWEMLAAVLAIPGKQIYEAEFPYRDWSQKLRVFDVSAT